MKIPHQVQQCLDLQNIDYGITADDTVDLSSLKASDIALNQHTPAPENIAILVILQDSIGKLQVMIPEGSLIDLTEVCELLGRNLQALSSDEQSKLLKEFGTDTLPSIPQLTGLPTIADCELFEKHVVYLRSGIEGHYIKLTQDQFKRTMNDVDLGKFSKPIPNENRAITGADAPTDEASIVKAVEKFTTLRIKQRLEKTLEIPPMPSTADKIIKLRVDPDAGVGELAQIVETDPSLAAQVVSWAGSPFYGAPGKIKSVHDAVVRVLGFDLVINLALGLALGKTFNLPKDGPRSITPYWQQAVYSALAMESLVSKIPSERRPTLGLSYLSGLLHNFGYLILGFVFPPHFSVIGRYLEVNRHISHHHIEQHVLGVSREQISGWLLKSWNMPDQIVNAIRWQQHPSYEGKHAIYANLLYITHQLLRKQQIGSQNPQTISNELYERVGLTPEAAQEAIDAVIDKSTYIKSMAKVLGNNSDEG